MAILRKAQHFWPALWLAVLVVLLAILAIEHFFGGFTAGAGPRAPARIVEARLLPPFSLPAEAPSGSETVARPLFVPTRRPAPPLAAAPAQAMRRGQFVLTGVTIVPEVAFAFLRETASGKTHSVKKGSMVNGITVDTVEPRRVVLRMGEETEELHLNTQVPAKVAVTPPPTGAVPPAPGTVVAPPPPRPPQPGVPAPGAAPAKTGAAASQAGAAPPAAPVAGRRRPWTNAQ